MFNRNAALARTPEQIEEDTADQAEAKKRLEGKIKTPILSAFEYALVAETAAREARDDVLQSMTETDNEDVLQTLRGLEGHHRRSLAAALSAQGNMQEAMLWADDTQRKEWQPYADALETLNFTCACPDKKQVRDGRSAKGIELPQKRVVHEIYAGYLDAEVEFIKCDGCGLLSARKKTR